ncbi:MAG: isoprenylcysteine carboxylmethyltransferase family protein [Chloroflexi bacterium]|nr:isoprenylcysteine carboxylmethyltransferase family protein [Chloroflexota bacterium]
MVTFFDTFQLITLIAFLVIFIGRSIFLYTRNGINPWVLGVGKAGLRRIVELSFFVGLLLWLVEVVIYVFNWEWRIFSGVFSTSIAESMIAKILGMIVIVLGFGLFVWALIAFGKSWRVGIDETTPGDLVTHGVFGVSRNPIFLFIDLYFFGTFLINGTIFFLLATLAVIVGLHYQIIQEERFLMENYGESYFAYAKKVGRYFTL